MHYNTIKLKSEYEVCKQIANYISFCFPDVLYHFDFGSGIKMTIGQAVKNKRINLQRGYPDLFISEPRGKYHGLFIEVKRGKFSKTEHTREQENYLNELCKRGYLAVFGVGYDDCEKIINNYLKS